MLQIIKNKVLVMNYTYNLRYMNAIHQKILCSQRHVYQYIQRNTKSFPQHKSIFTDCSKQNNHTATAVVQN